ncbi:MAG TPA: DUF924 domain-containing protein [Candidatus Omnitrophica bacterium]|nr:MAG: hypothetical protein A2Z81_06705 [Omnitrophica WOR_2 bacterium GWA2_45_18]HBR15091.1 DUF924 domain-containing protein [Candidatus Omnitrophota bacterium]
MDKILEFWFEGLNDQTVIDKRAFPAKKWFIKNRRVDDEIREAFEHDLIRAGQGEFKDWERSARGRLALVILFDQFPRNIYRNTPKMFAYDPLALDLAVRSIREEKDQELQLIERVFLYMPLMHAEDVKTQTWSVERFTHLLTSAQLMEHARRAKGGRDTDYRNVPLLLGKSVVRESSEKSPANTPYYEYTLGYARRHFSIIEKFGRFPHRNSILGRTSTMAELEFLNTPNASF